MIRIESSRTEPRVGVPPRGVPLALALLAASVHPAPAADAPPASGDAFAVRLRSAATCTRAAVRLSDVAEPVGETPWPKNLGRLVIALMPPDGRPLSMTRREVARRARAEQRLAWSGAESVTVSRNDRANADPADNRSTAVRPTAPREMSLRPASATASRRWSTSQLQQMVEQAVGRSLGTDASLYAIQVDWEEPMISRLSTARRIGEARLTDATAGRHRAALEIVTAEGLEEVELPVELRPLATAVAAARPLRRGELVSTSDLVMKPVPEGETVPAVPETEMVIGQELRRSVPSGGWISSDDVGPPTVVRRNDLVELRVVGGGVTIRTAARVLQSAAVGDVVPVETLDRRRKLIARVSGPNEVEITTRPRRVAEGSRLGVKP